MEDPISRRLSLETWPKKRLFSNWKEFGQAGFYYGASPLERESDRLYCAFCPLGLKDWAETDNPWVEHAKYGPSCVHLQSVKGRRWIKKHACRFRPTPQNIKKVQNNELLPLLGESIQRREQFVIVNDNGYRSPNGVKFTFPDDPGRGKLRDRLATLKGSRYFPAPKSPKAWDFASAGFHLTNEGLRCFHCSCIARNFDVDEDPYILHATANPRCYHLVLECGELFINHVTSKRMDRKAVQEENQNTNAGCTLKNCNNCRQLLREDECVHCLKCRSMVCFSEDCRSHICCENL